MNAGPTKNELQLQIQARLVEELSQSKREFETLIDLLEEIVFRCDQHGRLTLINPSWEAKLGYAQEDTLGQLLGDYVISVDDREKLAQAFQSGLSLSMDIKLQSRFGEPRSFNLRARKDGADWCGSLFDVTEQQLTLRALKESENLGRKLSLVARGTDNIVIITDAEGRIDWVNRGFEQATGYSLREVRGYPPGDILQGAETSQATINLMSDAIARGEGFATEIINYRKSGEAYWVSIDCKPVFDDDGVLQNFIAIERDITEAKESAQMMLQAKEDAESLTKARTRFVANMSHEIRTPLNAILGMTGVLEDSSMSIEQRGCLDIIRSSGNALLELVNDVLDFSKLESGQLHFDAVEFQILDVFEQAVDIVVPSLREKRLSFRMYFDTNVPMTLTGDPHRIRQVLLNLLSNAIKFTKTGGIQLNVGWEGGPTGEGKLQVTVSDSGLGIDPDRIEMLFDEFTQADPSTTREFGGTGLGLAICRQICEQSGGRIWAESCPGEGADFHFEMRLQARENTAASSVAWTLEHANLDMSEEQVLKSLAHCMTGELKRVSEKGDTPFLTVISAAGERKVLGLDSLHNILTPMRVWQCMAESLGIPDSVQQGRKVNKKYASLKLLIAEDVKANQIVLKTILERLGCAHIDIVDNGQQAVDAVTTGEYDLVLMDVHMPVLDGLLAAENIRRITEIRQPMIVAVSADATTDARLAANEAGIDQWLPKPVSRDEIDKVLGSVLRRSSIAVPVIGKQSNSGVDEEVSNLLWAAFEEESNIWNESDVRHREKIRQRMLKIAAAMQNPTIHAGLKQLSITAFHDSSIIDIIEN